MSAKHEELEPLSPYKIARYSRATDSLRNQAAKHANFGRFKLAERPEGHYQDFREVYFPPVESPDLEIIAGTCRMVMGETDGVSNFDLMLQAFQDNAEAVDEAKAIINSGGRIMLITPHRELADVAMAMAGAQVSINDPGLVKGTRITVGPIIKELEIVGVPAIDALQLSSGVIVGMPDTANTEQQIVSGLIDQEVMSEANTAVKIEFENQIVNDEVDLLATAPSGSTDDESESHILMKSVSRGTNTLARRYFSGSKNGIWPIALVINEGRVAFEVGGVIHLDRKDGLHLIMREYLAPMYSRVSGKDCEYQWPDDSKTKKQSQRLGRIANNS